MEIILIREIIKHYVEMHPNVPCVHCGELVNFIRENENEEASAERKIALLVPNIYNQRKVGEIAKMAGYQADNYVINIK